MTTIAYRDGTLAADTLVCERGYRVGTAVKIGRAGPLLFGVAGTLAHMIAFRDWMAKGAVGDPPSVAASPGENDDGSQAFIIIGDLIVGWDRDRWDVMRAPFYAVGSGAKAALGAMYAGASAEDAVRAGIAADTYSGGNITVLRREG